MSEATTTLKPVSTFRAVLLGLGGFLLFAFIANLILRDSAKIATPDEKRARERGEILKKLQADDKAKLESYGWADPAKKIIRLPVERAMELVLPDLQSKPVKAAYPIAGLTPVPANPAPVPAPVPQPPKVKIK